MNTVEIASGVSPAVATPVIPANTGGRGGAYQAIGVDPINEGSDPVSLGRFGALNSQKEVWSQVATEVRGLGQARQLIERAQQELDLVFKSFPPFPPGSVERERYLNSVAGIRSIIEKLTIPPEPVEKLKEALAQPALIDSEVADELLPAGIDGLSRAESVLASVQAQMAHDALPPSNLPEDESYVVGQSRLIGMELLRRGTPISRSPEAVRALIA